MDNAQQPADSSIEMDSKGKEHEVQPQSNESTKEAKQTVCRSSSAAGLRLAGGEEEDIPLVQLPDKGKSSKKKDNNNNNNQNQKYDPELNSDPDVVAVEIRSDEDLNKEKKKKNKQDGKEDKEGGDEKKKDPVVFSPHSEFDFWREFKKFHKSVSQLKGYKLFFIKWLALEYIRLACVLSFVILAFTYLGDSVRSLDNLSTGQYFAFASIAFLNVVAQIIPNVTMCIIDDIKMQLQVSQATALVQKIFDLEHNAVLSTPTGEFAQLLAKVYTNFDRLLPGLYGQVFPMALETFVAVILISSLYGWIGVLQLVLFAVITEVSYRQAKKKAERNKEMMGVMFTEWAGLLATVSSYEIAHFFNNVDFEVGKSRKSFTNMGSKLLEVTQGEHKDKAFGAAIGMTLTAIWIIVLLLAISGDVTVIEFVALAFYYLTFLSSLGAAYTQGVAELRTGLLQLVTLTEFVERRTGIADVAGAVDIKRHKNPDIEFRNVTFAYKNKLILDKVSFKVKGGETLGLVGSSGCGKSTILRLLLRFYKHESGSIYVDGHDITKVTAKSLRNLFSVVTQDSQLFNKTIKENIRYGKMGESDEEVLKAAGLAELKFADDFTLDKVCGEKGAKLSGGQQQRVSLARAMLKNGTIYLLDEPTTGLDGIVSKQLQATLDSLATNATTIMVTHHLEDLRNVNQIIYLDKGKIIERGTYESLIRQKGVFYRQTQARMKESSSDMKENKDDN